MLDVRYRRRLHPQVNPPLLAELCAGYGGLGLALQDAGINHQLAWWADTDPHASTVMEAHTNTPNHGDITTLHNPPPADIIAAGFPCQPVSVAGQRKGTQDERWIVDDVCRVARLAGAQWLILENVDGIRTANNGNALARTCAAMAREGFRRWEWCTLRASDVGAPHQRKRWFCIAHSENVGRQRPRPPRLRGLGPEDHGDTPTDANGRPLGLQPIGLTGSSDTALAGPDRPAPTDADEAATTRTAAQVDGVPINALLGRVAWQLLPTPTAQDAASSGSAGYQKTATHSPGVTLTDATVRGLGAMPKPSSDGNTPSDATPPTPPTTADSTPDSSSG